MSEAAKSGRGLPLLLAVASFVIIVAGMRAAEALLVPFLLSVFLAVISAPPLFWLERRGFPKTLAMLTVIAGIVCILLLMAAIFGTSVDAFTQKLPEYQAHLRATTDTLVTWLHEKGIRISDPEVAKYLDPGAILRLVANTLNGLGGVLGNIFLIFLTVVFILFEASSFPVKLRAILRNHDASLGDFAKFTDSVRNYLAIKTWTSLATGIAVAVWLKVLGVDFAILWGLLAFLLNYIPSIGSIIAAIPAVLLALLQLGIAAALWTASGYVVINIIIGTVIEPRFMGRHLGLSTLVVFVSLVFWGWVLGPVGMFLSVPLTMTLKLAMENDQRTRWMAILLGSEAAAEALLPAATEAKEPAQTKPSPLPSDDA